MHLAVGLGRDRDASASVPASTVGRAPSTRPPRTSSRITDARAAGVVEIVGD